MFKVAFESFSAQIIDQQYHLEIAGVQLVALTVDEVANAFVMDEVHR